jgi:hypothetical protein
MRQPRTLPRTAARTTGQRRTARPRAGHGAGAAVARPTARAGTPDPPEVFTGLASARFADGGVFAEGAPRRRPGAPPPGPWRLRLQRPRLCSRLHGRRLTPDQLHRFWRDQDSSSANYYGSRCLMNRNIDANYPTDTGHGPGTYRTRQPTGASLSRSAVASSRGNSSDII